MATADQASLNNTYYRNGAPAVYDRCRKMLLCSGPEELVRQTIVNHLIEKMRVPEHLIATEYHLGRISPKARDRADIVVWAEKDERAILVIEVKAEGYTTGAPLEQVMRYQKTLTAPYVGVACSSDCSLLQIHKVIDGNAVHLDVQPSFEDMISGHGVLSEIDPLDMLRVPYLAAVRDDHIAHLKDEIYVLGEDTPEEIAPFVACLHNFIMSAPVEIQLPFEIGGMSIIQDLGLSERSYGNAGGGSWGMVYRGFHVRDFEGNDQFCWISVGASATKDINTKVGYARSTTTLIVAIDDYDSSHNALQLCLDDNVVLDEEEGFFDIWHNGRMTHGKRGPVKLQTVLEFIKGTCPNLIENNKIYLGTIPTQEAIGGQNGWEFISRLLLYAVLRDQLRNHLKNDSVTQTPHNKNTKNVRPATKIRDAREDYGIEINEACLFFEQPFARFYASIAANALGELNNLEITTEDKRSLIEFYLETISDEMGVHRVLSELLQQDDLDQAWLIRMSLNVSDLGNLHGFDSVYIHNTRACVGGGPLHNASDEYPADWKHWNPYIDEQGKALVFNPFTEESKPLKKTKFKPVDVWLAPLADSVWLADDEWNFVRVDLEGLKLLSA